MTTTQFTDQEKLTLAASILKTGKSLAPDRFPKPNPETTQLWSYTLSALFDKFPFPEMWRDAVVYWCLEKAGQWMVTPRDIRDCVFSVRDRWDRDPVRSVQLREWREVSQSSRMAELARGVRK